MYIKLRNWTDPRNRHEIRSGNIEIQIANVKKKSVLLQSRPNFSTIIPLSASIYLFSI